MFHFLSFLSGLLAVQGRVETGIQVKRKEKEDEEKEKEEAHSSKIKGLVLLRDLYNRVLLKKALHYPGLLLDSRRPTNNFSVIAMKKLVYRRVML